MRVLVILPVVQILHQLRRGITQMQGYRRIARLFYRSHRSVYRQISRIALRRSRKIDHTLRQGYAGFRHSYFMHYLKASVRYQQGIRVCQTYIFGGRDNQASRYKFRVFSPQQHTCHPVNRRVRVSPADRLDHRRHDIIMLFPVFIVHQRVFMQLPVYRLVVDNNISLA